MTSAKDRKIRELETKAELLRVLPYERKIYSDPIEYGKATYWKFNPDEYSDDSSNMESLIDSMNESNEKAQIFNNLLEKVFKALE